MDAVLECAGWRQNSCDDGPGIRSVLFLQGCRMNCPGCHNKVFREKGNGVLVSVSELFAEIRERCKNKKITISGGEPLEQKESLLPLLRLLNGTGFNICLYTGWSLECVPQAIIEQISFLKTGNYEASLRNPKMRYAGSENQHFYENYNGVLKKISLI